MRTAPDLIAAAKARPGALNHGSFGSGGSPEGFERFIRAEIARWAEVVQVSGAKVDWGAVRSAGTATPRLGTPRPGKPRPRRPASAGPAAPGSHAR